ncbi:MAG TPA: hypothetical protein VEV87_06030 [Chitinophagaceae bacterium]|nr:hypothetical protein [Chitinophagaceae bacterium]
MKKIVFVFLLLGFYSSQAQSWRLNGYAMYVFDDRIDSYYSSSNYFNATVQGGLQWGGGFEYMVQNVYGIELLYMRQDTKAPATYYDQIEKSAEIDVSINYIMLGFNRYQRFSNPKIEGYGGMMLGVGIFDVTNPNNGKTNNSTKFAWGIRAGLNIFASERFGIKLQTSLMSAVQSVGGGLYFGTGGGGAGVSTFSSMLQFGLGGGIVVPFGGGTTAQPKQM